MNTIKIVATVLLSLSFFCANAQARSSKDFKGPKFKFKNKDEYPVIKMKDYSGYSKTKGIFSGYGRETIYHSGRKKVHYYRGGWSW